jgi:anti-anti-sigma factor
MAAQIQDRGQQHPRQFQLPGKLDVRSALQLKGELAALSEDGSNLVLNGSAVTKMSTAACQVVAAFIVSIRSVGGRAQIVAPSRQMQAALVTLGLGSFLEEEV